VVPKVSPLAIRGAVELDGRRPRLRYRGWRQDAGRRLRRIDEVMGPAGEAFECG